MFASYFQSDEVQDEAEVRGSPPPYRPMTGARARPLWPYSFKFALYWASLVSLCAMQLKVELLSAIFLLPYGLRPPICTLYRLHYLHIFVYPFFNSVSGRGSVFSFHRGREEAVHCDRLRRHIVECSFGRECIEALWQCAYLTSLNFPGEARGCSR